MVGVASFLLGGLGFLKRLPWQLWAILGALLGLWLLWGAHTRSVSHARADGFAEGRKDASTTFVAAQAEASRLATIAKQVKEQQYETARARSAEVYADLSGRYRAAVLRLATKADPRSPGTADLPGNAEGAGLPEDPTGDAFVSVSQSDAMICANNTAYAMASYEWAKGLADER